MKIIAVDDEMESLSNFLVEIIDNKKVEYRFFLENPLDSLDYCKNNQVDAAFLDIRMPLINGVDLAERLIKINNKIQIVFITGFTFDEEEIKKRLGDNLLGFCYKPFDSTKLNNYINQIAANGKRDIRISTFSLFDVFINDKPVDFKSTKAKELLALLVAYNGSTLVMNDAISYLWPDREVELAKKLYRDAIWRLRKTLTDNGIPDLVEFSKAKTVIRKEGVQCDLWDYIDGNNTKVDIFSFMTPYNWSTTLMNEIINKKKVSK